MKFCQDHWDRLRHAIEDRGLSDLIAPDGQTVVAQMADQLERAQDGKEPSTPVNYDPLMSAHWAIVNNAMDTVKRAGGDPLYLMMGGPEDAEDPVVGYGEAYEGRTWPRCPLCYVGLAHEMTCTDPRCALPKVNGFDWMIDRAADDQAEHVKTMRAGEPS